MLTFVAVVNLDCSPAVGCANITFENFDVTSQGDPEYLCANVDELEGLPGQCPGLSESPGFHRMSPHDGHNKLTFLAEECSSE